MEPKTGLLGVQDKTQQPRPRPVKTTADGPKAAPVKIPTSSSAGAPPIAIGGALVALVVGFFLANAIFSSLFPAILAAFIIAAVTFVLLNPKPRGGIRS